MSSENHLDIESLLEQKLISKVSPEEIEAGNKVIASLQLGTEIEVLLVFHYIDDKHRSIIGFQLPISPQVEPIASLAFFEASETLRHRFYGSIPHDVFHKLRDLLKMSIFGPVKAINDLGVKLPSNREDLLAYLSDLFSLPLDRYSGLYRLNPPIGQKPHETGIQVVEIASSGKPSVSDQTGVEPQGTIEFADDAPTQGYTVSPFGAISIDGVN